jgi:hypothetical protein
VCAVLRALSRNFCLAMGPCRIEIRLRVNIINPPVGRNGRLIFIRKQIIFPVACLFINGCLPIRKKIIDNAGCARRQRWCVLRSTGWTCLFSQCEWRFGQCLAISLLVSPIRNNAVIAA